MPEERLPIPPQVKELRDYVTWWNSTYPIDRWWRNKHGVIFGSKEHNDHCLLDMRFEFEEDILYKSIELESGPEKDEYNLGRGDWIKKREKEPMNEAEVDDLFENVDIGNIKEERGADGKLRINANIFDE